MAEEKVCTACMFCRHVDYGWFNWTVMGTSRDCLWEMNGSTTDEATDDAQHEWAKVAENCQFYREGTGIYEDCDGEAKEENIKEWIRIHIKEAA